MRISLSFRLRLDVARATDPEPERHEHRDTDAVVELSAPSSVGFRIPGVDDA